MEVKPIARLGFILVVFMHFFLVHFLNSSNQILNYGHSYVQHLLGSLILVLVPIASKQLVYVLVHFFPIFLGFLLIFTPGIDYICRRATSTFSSWIFLSKSWLLLKVSCTLQIIFQFLAIIVLYVALNLMWKIALLFNANAIHLQQHWHPNLMFDLIAFANF